MRFYTNAYECYEEVKRDLKEMGIVVRPNSMQDKVVKGDPNYETFELQNYSYCLMNADPGDISTNMPVNKPWADMEIVERTTNPWLFGDTPIFINPGTAFRKRNDVWNEYLGKDGKFSYTYNERIWQNNQLTKIIYRLKEDPDNRQSWLSIWDPNRDTDMLGGISRVPCSLGYGFQIRNGKLNMHYVMRSCDFITHFANDVYLASRLLGYVSRKVGVESGDLTHTMFSLHVYRKDVKDVF